MSRKYTQEEVEIFFAKQGFTLTDIYVKYGKPVKATCPLGHPCLIALSMFLYGHRCPTCSKKKKYTQEQIIDIFAKKGYIVLSEYVNSKTAITVLCPKNHKDKSLIGDFINGHGCKKCVIMPKKYTSQQAHLIFESEGYLIMGDYNGCRRATRLICPKKHSIAISMGGFQKGVRCQVCGKRSISRMETDLFNFIKNKTPNTIRLRDYKINIPNKPYIKRFEIDIYIPELKKGIEFDGKYWHSFEKMRKDKRKKSWPDDDILNYHQIKDGYFLSQGIEIIHIKEEDWIKDKQACIDRCLDFLKVPFYPTITTP